MNRTQRPFPLGPLLGAGALIVLALVLAGVARFTGFGAVPVVSATAVEVRALRFEDRADGAVVVREDGTREVVQVLAPGTNGFVRSVMRGLARERKMKGFDDEAPFELVRWDDNRLSLIDTATKRQIELVSFGITQLEVFAEMLHAGKDDPEYVRLSHAKEENQ